jgi:hypothetical protein
MWFPLRCYVWVIALACSTCIVFAADPKPPAKMDEPMAGKMKKPGMKQGDVKKQAEKKRRAMKPMLEKEEKEMQGQRAPAGVK